MMQERKFSGDRLRQARLRKGWTQAELARYAGIRERQIIRMEREQHVPRVDMVAAVAGALEAPFDSFFDDDALRERRESAGADDDLMGALTSTIDRLIERRVSEAVRRERSAV